MSTIRVRRVVTTRHGGASAAPYDSFNLGEHVGDCPEAVAANRERLASGIGLPVQRLVWMEQVHGRTVAVVDGPQLQPIRPAMRWSPRRPSWRWQRWSLTVFRCCSLIRWEMLSPRCTPGGWALGPGCCPLRWKRCGGSARASSG